jgi:hypothetical protein
MLLRTKVARTLAVLGILGSLLVAMPVNAAPRLPDAEIWVDNGGEATAAAAGMEYGDHVSFDFSMSGKMAKNYYLTIRVTCTQGDTVVYKWFGQPDFAFPLINQGGNTMYWDGGAAECEGALRYFANNRLSIVATTTFSVGGAAS